jgi:flavin reductase (DIM6/NTAB) family NADH-FMN oxidoreductase RutF
MAFGMTSNKMKLVQGKAIAALLTPCPVILLTSFSAEGTPNVMSVAWHTPLSYDPPMVGVSIDIRRYSHRLISESGEFGINVMSREFQKAVEECGNQSGRNVDKIKSSNLELVQANHIRTPMLKAALAHIECKVEGVIRTGDHSFFIGCVVYAEAVSAQFDNGWNPITSNVLLCTQRDKFGVFHE